MNGYVSEDKGHSHSFDSNHQQLQLERGFLGRYSQLIHAFSFSLYLFSFSPIQDCLNGWDFVFLKKHKNTVSYNIHSLQKGFRLSLSLSLSLSTGNQNGKKTSTHSFLFLFFGSQSNLKGILFNKGAVVSQYIWNMDFP